VAEAEEAKAEEEAEAGAEGRDPAVGRARPVTHRVGAEQMPLRASRGGETIRGR
jgi:hypothetical protein